MLSKLAMAIVSAKVSAICAIKLVSFSHFASISRLWRWVTSKPVRLAFYVANSFVLSCSCVLAFAQVAHTGFPLSFLSFFHLHA